MTPFALEMHAPAKRFFSELDGQKHLHNEAGIVSLVIKSKDLRQPQKKLVAVKGKLEMIEVLHSAS